MSTTEIRATSDVVPHKQNSIGVDAYPAEVRAPPAESEDYISLRAQTDLREPYKITTRFLHGIKSVPIYEAPETPLIAFINARSGGRVGPALAFTLYRALGFQQVFDLSEYPPHKVLPALWANLQAHHGEPLADHIRGRIRILAAGGDGTVAWIMKTIKDLGLQPPPAIAIMPLGTGNDLSRTFNWGECFYHTWIKDTSSIYATLKRIADAEVVDLDAWRVRITIPDSSLLGDKPHSLYKVKQDGAGAAAAAAAAPEHAAAAQQAAAGEVELTGMQAAAGAAAAAAAAGDGADAAAHLTSTAAAALQQQEGVPAAANGAVADGTAVAGDAAVPTVPPQPAAAASSSSSSSSSAAAAEPSISMERGPGDGQVLEGMFWNYLSVGMDAKAAHGFHRLRETKPHLTVGRLTNQFWYGYYSCANGAFCCSTPVRQRLKLFVQTAGKPGWQQVELPGSIKAVVLVNLQSYAGGRNLWGYTDSSRKGFTTPSYNDGAIEVVGLRNGWHTGMVLGSHGRLVHAKRLAQATAVRMELRVEPAPADGEPGRAYLQIDGEPWLQPIPGSKQGPPLVVEVHHAGVSKLLLNKDPLNSLTADLAKMVSALRVKKHETQMARELQASQAEVKREVAAGQQQQQQQGKEGKEEGLVTA